MSFGARALIRLGALNHNLAVIRRQAPDAAVMAVVKANAYGHGLSVVADALPDADSFAVARIAEAHELRAAGITKPIVLLSGVFSDKELAAAAQANCELVLHDDLQIRLLEKRPDLALTCWLKIDTGMHRLGFPVERAADLIDRLTNCTAVSNLRLMTHLANADDRSDAKTAAQLADFRAVAEGFSGDLSIANSGGLFGWPDAAIPDYLAAGARAWIRPGISLYGISPFPEKNGADLGLQAVMQLESRLVAVKTVREGQPVGYGGRWRAPRDSVIGIVSAGYGDGYPRNLGSGTPVLVNGRVVTLAGTVSMDMAAVDLGPGATDRVGDPVLLWGDALPVEEVSRVADAFAYQLVCGVMNREASTVIG